MITILESRMTTVSDPARWAAAYRAIETSRKDALFRDPYSEQLAGPRGRVMVARAPRQSRNGWPVTARTIIIDEFVAEAVSFGCDCIINLAVGFDTRPYRLSLPPSLSWVEADLPALIEEKEVLL
jgi:methyltransferase (TIGR00027 family)